MISNVKIRTGNFQFSIPNSYNRKRGYHVELSLTCHYVTKNDGVNYYRTYIANEVWSIGHATKILLDLQEVLACAIAHKALVDAVNQKQYPYGESQAQLSLEHLEQVK